ncbi:MAG: hypothetical protein JWR26_2619 [Pedosphaera sp.]|nr:hypothetical protein [Pedosphaera sp.]
MNEPKGNGKGRGFILWVFIIGAILLLLVIAFAPA